MTDESEMFTRIVRVNRSQTPLQALEAFTNHKQYLTESVVSGMPLGTDEEVTLHFFPIKKGLSSAEFEAEFKKRNLKPDPMAQAEYNEKNPAFADRYPNVSLWKNEDGHFCYALWRDWDGYRRVRVRRNDGGWSDGSFACGVRK